ncbi:MAG: hypothetical protein GH148_01575 [Clostridia bacterium]|nr:hypothetical protein [Clostridia bacterium]
MRHFTNRRKKSGVVFAILGILLMLASITAVYYWETKGRDKFLYGEVLVLNQSVEANTTITEDMLEVIKTDPGNFIEGAVVNKNEVIGKSAMHYIPKYSQLNLAYFIGEKVEAAKEDQYIFTIPPDWIITFPNSLRRGDEIYFYPVKIPEVNKEGEDKNNSFNTSKSMKIAKEENMIKGEVAYLKDSGNREVVTIAGEERDDASANIASIEVIANYEDISYLQGLVDENWKFIILFKDYL